MKLQNISNLILQQDDLNNVKGGKRIATCGSPQMHKLLANTVIPKTTSGNITSTIKTNIQIQANIYIEWRSVPCKKP